MVARISDLHGKQNARPVRGVSYSPVMVKSAMGILDALIIFASGMIILSSYVGWSKSTYGMYLVAMAINVGVTVSIFNSRGLYTLGSLDLPLRQIKKILPLYATVFLILLSIAFGLKISDHFSRIWAFSWWLSSTTLMCLSRVAAQRLIHRFAQSGHIRRNIALFGAGEQGNRIIKQLQSENDPWDTIVGVFDDRGSRAHPDLEGRAVKGSVDELYAYCRSNNVDEVIVALPSSADERIIEIVNKLCELPVNVRIASDLIGLHFIGSSYSTMNGVHMLDVATKPEAGWRFIFKVVQDRVLGALLVLLTLPLLLLIAIAIRIDSPGPILFRQRRYGFNRELILIYKFRSMYHEQEDESAVTSTTKNDPRVTRVGAFLRRTSLDELPQLFNVLKGEMSIVGPRPHAMQSRAAGALFEDAVDGYANRHKVKPGITGWAQVNGWRGETDTIEKLEERVRHDIYYIEHWSVFLEIWIFIRTISAVFKRTNAY